MSPVGSGVTVVEEVGMVWSRGCRGLWETTFLMMFWWISWNISPLCVHHSTSNGHSYKAGCTQLPTFVKYIYTFLFRPISFFIVYVCVCVCPHTHSHKCACAYINKYRGHGLWDHNSILPSKPLWSNFLVFPYSLGSYLSYYPQSFTSRI